MSLEPDLPHFIIFLQQMHSISTDIVGGLRVGGSSRNRMGIQGFVRVWLLSLIVVSRSPSVRAGSDPSSIFSSDKVFSQILF